MGSLNSNARTAEQTLYSHFWAASTANYFWNSVAVSLAQERHLTFSEESHLLAVLNLAMADAAIGCWDTKYAFVLWRPVTAIPLAATDSNPFTIEDVNWVPLLATPAHPEYASGHSCASGSAGRVLSSFFGDNTTFSFSSDSPAMAGVIRNFTTFTQALDEIKNARVFAGIHFRSACDDGQALGVGVADYVLGHALLPVNGRHSGQLKD